MTTPRLFAVITAAGFGTRLGFDLPKAFVPINGRTILAWVVRALASYRYPTSLTPDNADYNGAAHGFDTMVISLPDGSVDTADAIITKELGHTDHVRLVPGGVSRQQSVHLALQELDRVVDNITDDDIVLIFDAARCAVPHDVITRVIDQVQRARTHISPDRIAVIPALPVVDTVYEIDDSRTVSRILDRDTLVNVQTPQGFYARAIIEAHRAYADTGTDEAQSFGDDAQLIMARGGTCFVVDGDTANLKVTHSDDLSHVSDFLRE